jgi:hypothetical protein
VCHVGPAVSVAGFELLGQARVIDSGEQSSHRQKPVQASPIASGLAAQDLDAVFGLLAQTDVGKS